MDAYTRILVIIIGSFVAIAGLYCGLLLGIKCETLPIEYRVSTQNQLIIGATYSVDWCNQSEAGKGGYIAQVTYDQSGAKCLVYFAQNEPPQRFVVSNNRQLLPFSVIESTVAESSPPESG